MPKALQTPHPLQMMAAIIPLQNLMKVIIKTPPLQFHL